MSAFSIGVDLGGTNLRVAAVDEQGTVVDRVNCPVNYDEGATAVIGVIVQTIKDITTRVGHSGLRGVGIGVPGFIDVDAGLVVQAANLPGFRGFPVRDEMERHLGTRIILENDANAAALGEKWIGAGRDVNDLILITLGTGIGGGIVSDGKIMRGSSGFAGEIGHMTVFPDGNPCGCGNYGCLEKHASASAIAAMASMMGIATKHFSAREVYELAMEGNDRARMVFESMGRSLGIAIASLINVFNFPLYLLSGGPLPAWDFFAPAMFAEISRRSFAYGHSGTRVEKAVLGSDAGLLGAAYLPFQQHAAEAQSLLSTPVNS